jgi:hypothetical protein
VPYHQLHNMCLLCGLVRIKVLFTETGVPLLALLQVWQVCLSPNQVECFGASLRTVSSIISVCNHAITEQLLLCRWCTPSAGQGCTCHGAWTYPSSCRHRAQGTQIPCLALDCACACPVPWKSACGSEGMPQKLHALQLIQCMQT